jgi:UDP-glucose 4-epimerase
MILIVGGAGYIGSHVVKQLLNQNNEAIVLDNLSTGHRKAVDPRAIFIQGDIRDESLLTHIFTTYKIEGVMHFAAHCLVGESVMKPFKYYENNVAATLCLLRQMLLHNVNKLIFSSTCSTYGIPNVELIDENCPTNPINPYGHSKLMVEQILSDFSKAYGLSYVVLRYFNAAGAEPNGEIGEDHTPESHLIPNVLLHLLGKKSNIEIFGDNYGTRDGTCVRDYIHVLDLADAHIRALEHILATRENQALTYNLGSGKGYSVLEVIKMCELVTGKKANIIISPPRSGDPGYLVANCEKIKKELNWWPVYTLKDIVHTAWNWHTTHPDGY